LQHSLGEKLRALAQARGVVCLKVILDQLNDRSLFGDRRRGDPLALQVSALVHSASR
jgi:hypothetical protein